MEHRVPSNIRCGGVDSSSALGRCRVTACCRDYPTAARCEFQLISDMTQVVVPEGLLSLLADAFALHLNPFAGLPFAPRDTALGDHRLCRQRERPGRLRRGQLRPCHAQNDRRQGRFPQLHGQHDIPPPRCRCRRHWPQPTRSTGRRTWERRARVGRNESRDLTATRTSLQLDLTRVHELHFIQVGPQTIDLTTHARRNNRRSRGDWTI
jgi:hypothetical protein